MPPAPHDDVTDPVGVAVVGAGYWGPNLVRNFLASDDIELHAVCDLDLARARRVVGRAAGVTVTTSIEEVLEDDRVEAIAIATPVSTHVPLALRAIEAGRHVLVEKPLAQTAVEGRRLVDAAAAAGVRLMCDHTFCYTAAVDHIRAELAGGGLGRIHYLDSVRINLGLIQRDVDVLWDLLPHDISIFDSIVPGGFRPVQVAATGSDPIGCGQISVAYVTMLLPDDAIAHVHVSWLSPVKIRKLVVGGSEGHLVWDDTNPAQKVSVYDRGIDVSSLSTEDAREQLVQYRIGDVRSPALRDVEALRSVVRELAAAVRSGRAPKTPGESGLRVLEVLEAAHRSLGSGSRLVDVGS